MSESAGAGDHCWPVTSNKCVPPSHDNLAAVCLFVSLVPAASLASTADCDQPLQTRAHLERSDVTRASIERRG